MIFVSTLASVVIYFFVIVSPTVFAWTPTLRPSLQTPKKCPFPKYSNSRRRKTTWMMRASDMAHSFEDGRNGEGSLEECYEVQVSYEGRSCEMLVEKGESILSAMERTKVPDQLALPSVPFECRRGNCLTCTGRHVEGSVESNVMPGEDGLSPHVSEEVKGRGFVLTCSSYVVGDGVKLKLGENDEAWSEMNTKRFQEESIQQAGREAMARVIRLNAERNLQAWAKETEKVFQQSAD